MRLAGTILGGAALLGAMASGACGGGSSPAPHESGDDGGLDASPPGNDAGHATDASDASPSMDAAAKSDAGDAAVGPAPEGGSPGTWSMGYYAGYQSTLYPVASIDWAGLTHIAVAFYLPAADGSLDETLFLDATSGPALAQSIVQAAHAHGVKAIASIGGAGSGAALQGATSAGTMAKFVANLVGILSKYGYDGLDIDWEPLQTSDQAAAIALANQVRAAHPGARMTMPVGYENGNSPDDLSGYPAIAAVYDQVNIMSYGMAGAYSGWKSWHSGALHYTDSATPTSIDDSVGLYLKAGVPPGRLGFGIGFYGLCYTAPVTAPDQALGASTVAASDNDMSYANITTSYYSASAHQWDALALVPYLSLPAGAGPKKCTFVSYDDAQSIAEKGKYLKAKGLGGVIEWTINQGYVGGASPLLEAVKSDILQ